MPHELRLFLDRFEAKSGIASLRAVRARALYVVEGSLALRDSATLTTSGTLSANSAISAASACDIGSGSLGATVLRWELVMAAAADDITEAPTPSTTLLLSSPITLEAGLPYLLRCDRVDFPPGGEALTHVHQGGGIRCLLAGSIRIDTQGHLSRYGLLGAWFEAGPDPVHATADALVPTAFARVMILPHALLGGKTSISYVRAEDASRPKSQRYQIFIDESLGVVA